MNNQGMNNQQPAGQKEDYLDKGTDHTLTDFTHYSVPKLTTSPAVDAIEKKFGQASGHQVDPAKYRAQNEKFTDKLRGFIEKKTGKKVRTTLPRTQTLE